MTAPPDGRWTPGRTAAIRTALEKTADALRREMAGAEAQASVALDETCLDLAGVAARDLEVDHDVSQAENARAVLEQTEHALDRLDLGYYGTCERCGRAIPEDRLEVFPRATLCVPCLSEG